MKTIGLWSGVLLSSVLCLLLEEGAAKLRRKQRAKKMVIIDTN